LSRDDESAGDLLAVDHRVVRADRAPRGALELRSGRVARVARTRPAGGERLLETLRSRGPGLEQDRRVERTLLRGSRGREKQEGNGSNFERSSQHFFPAPIAPSTIGLWTSASRDPSHPYEAQRDSPGQC